MGIFLDTIEDNSELGIWRIEEKNKEKGLYSLLEGNFPLFECQICNQKFYSDSSLQDHIFNIHRNEISINSISRIKKIEENIVLYDYFDIDELFFNLQKQINRGLLINDWSVYKKIIFEPNENDLRKKYLQGILEYLSSHYYEIHKKNNDVLNDHFGRAYGYLKDYIFHSQIARQICCIIAFKMNWFDELKCIVNRKSLLYVGWLFFVKNYEFVSKFKIELPNKRDESGIIVDNFHQELLEIIKIYYCDRSELTFNHIQKLECLLDNSKNKNYLDKLTLFKARVFQEWGDSESAKKNYRYLRNHLIFGEEACSFNG